MVNGDGGGGSGGVVGGGCGDSGCGGGDAVGLNTGGIQIICGERATVHVRLEHLTHIM